MESDASRNYTLQWRFERRLATEHLGAAKYSRSTVAIGELVANALDARAALVDIQLHENDLGAVDSIDIADNGAGISPEDLRFRFMSVGVGSSSEPGLSRFGRFGVGRLAVHRIGSISRWTSVSEASPGQRTRVSFELRDELPDLDVNEVTVGSAEPVGTRIEILNLKDTGNESLSIAAVTTGLLRQYCSYLLGNPGCVIRVNEEFIDVQQMIDTSEQERIESTSDVPDRTTVRHLLLKKPVEHMRFPHQVLFSAKGRTVAHAKPEDAPPHYLGLVECDYLDSIIASNRESIIEMDGGFAALRRAALERVHAYTEKLQDEWRRNFIERARHEDYYPYRSVPTDPVEDMEQKLYDVVLNKLNEHANVEGMTARQKQTVFRLLKRSLDNENVLEVLKEVATLSDEEMETFRKVLEKTTLESIVKMSSIVSNRLNFLDILHELVYGDVKKHLKERSELHRILESECWLFGTQFHLATSDKSFRTIIARHREQAGLSGVTSEQVRKINGIRDIPDLFLCAVREFPVEPRLCHLLVELKAPAVKIGRKQLEEGRKYAETILRSREFDTQSVVWDVFVVSADISDEVQLDREQERTPFGCTHSWPEMRIWVFKWSELISRAKQEMQLVRKNLNRKSKELTVSEYLSEYFPEILKNIETRSEESSQN